MPVSHRFASFRLVVTGGVSLAVLMCHGIPVARAQSLQPSYSPPVNNGGGTNPGRADIITVDGSTSTITGDYNLRGTSAPRFRASTDSVAVRNQNGEVVSGYAEVDGRTSVALGTREKSLAVTYPDQIQGTRVTTLVFDNDRLTGMASTDTNAVTFVDTGASVYADLRLANIDASTVTIATGDKTASIYDDANFAILTADTGSTLYNVTGDSRIVYDSRTATMNGADQDGFSQTETTTVAVPVTTFSGIAFGNGDSVTDLDALKRYNTGLIAQLSEGTITPADYDARIRAAAITETRQVIVRSPAIAPYVAPSTSSERLFIKLDGSTLTTTADSELVGVVGVDGNSDGISTLILAQNGSTVVNNGTISQGEGGVGIRVRDTGSSLTNTATGVIGVGYEFLDRTGAVPMPSGLTDFLGYGTANIAIRATDNAVVVNQGIVNVANRDIPAHPENPVYGKANSGIAVSTGATASNAGTILIGGADSATAGTLGLFGGAAGMVAFNGGTATNTAAGTIRIGTSLAGNTADLAGVVDVLSVNEAAGMTSLSAGGSIVNAGAIRIGSLAQNASGMLVGGDGNTALNTGTITIDPSAATTPSARNVGIWVRGSSIADAVAATNAAGGVITVGGVNSVGLLVENQVAGGSARAINAGTIIVDGGLSVDRLRNYGMFVNAASSARQDGAVILRGEGAIGVHARNGATIEAGAGGTVDFLGADQIGYYSLGAGSRITVGSTTEVDTAGSTGIRVEDGATLTGAGLTLIVSGADAFGIVASGPSTGTTVDAAGARLTVSGAGATGVLIEGGATGLLGSAGAITLAGAGTTAGIVDGQKRALDGSAVGTPVAGTTLTSDVALGGLFDDLTGYVARNGGALTHGGGIAFTGARSTGILATTGGTVTQTGTISVASGTGIRIDGAGSTLAGAGTVSVGDGVAALVLANGGSASSTGSFSAGGAANAVLLSAGAGALTLGNGTVTASGTGNGIENAAASSAIRLNGTTVIASGSGSALHTAVTLDPASVATLTASGTNSTAFDFSGTGGATIASDLAIGTALTIGASGVGATGVRLATTGNVTLGGTITVTNAQGGAAVVGGPANSIVNNGTLTSASTVAPVVDLTGGTRAFTNTGTIGAASSTATALAGGGNGQAVTFSSGAVTGAVLLGAGADVFTMTGGTLAGAFSAGGGSDSATFRGLTNANLSGVTRIGGDGVTGGSDRLTFDATTSTGTRRITGWNTVALTNGSTLTADGDLTMAGGAVTIDRTSTYFAGGVNSAIGGGAPTVTNAGVIDLANGATAAGDTLTIRGNYVGQGGILRLQTVLGTDASPTDRLVIDGGTASGTTSVQIINVGGLGALTTGNGIEVIGAVNGARTTATTTKDAFTLAGTHVDAGAFEYRLYASDLAGTSESWFLRTQAGTPGTPGNTAYRLEVPLLAALPGRLQNADLAMLGTYHKRMGDDAGPGAGAVTAGGTAPGRVWGRFIAEDTRSRQRGDARHRTEGRLYGGQIGVDLFRFGDAGGHHDVGVYGGYIDTNARVNGFAGGIEGTYAGRLAPTASYAALYWTYQADTGFYADTVVQYAWYGGKARVANGTRIAIDGNGVLASLETGYPLALSPTWALEPQVQIIGQGLTIDDVAIPNAVVTQRTPGYLTGRLGLRLKGRYATATGAIQPYLRGNVWKGFASTDRTLFATAAATTVVRSRTSSLWGEAGVGLTWTLTPALAVYGESDYRFTLDDGQSATGRSISSSVGVKLRF